MSASAPAEPKISISMVHHDGLDLLRNCIESIRANPPACGYEIIIVDNASTDGAVAMLETEYPTITVLENASRKGFAENQNAGIQASRGRYIMLLNDDTIVHSGALDALAGYLDAHPRTAAVGPRVINSDGTLQISCHRFPSPARFIWESTLLTSIFPNSRAFGHYRSWPHDTERDVDFVGGAAMLVRREAIDDVGLFDTVFYMYSEETDWQKRMRDKGWIIAFTPAGVITHLGGQSIAGMQGRRLCEFHRSQKKYIYKHYGPPGAAVQKVTFIANSAVRLAAWSIVWLLIPPKRATASRKTLQWKRVLRLWLGLGPHEGLAETGAAETQART